MFLIGGDRRCNKLKGRSHTWCFSISFSFSGLTFWCFQFSMFRCYKTEISRDLGFVKILKSKFGGNFTPFSYKSPFPAETGAAINRKLVEIWDGLLGTPTISTSLITLRKRRLFLQKYRSPLCVFLTDFSRFIFGKKYFQVREDLMEDLCLFAS